MRRAPRFGAWLSLAGAILGPASATAAERGPTPEPTATAVVEVADGRLTVDLRDADLEDALSRIAERAGFELRTSGPLGRVTAAFTASSVEEGLRRLVQDHELMLVYRASEGGRGGGDLAEVRVFAATSSGATRGAGAASNASPAATLAEISRLSMTPGDPAAASRLAEIFRSAPESVVRARAVTALGRVGGAGAAPTLGSALGDAAPDVRVQAVYAVARVDGARSLAALRSLLQRDPDASVRRAAARMLATLPDAAATAALQSASADSDASVRQEAARALQGREPRAADGG